MSIDERALGALIARAGHDLKNPLAVVITNLRYVQAEKLDGELGEAIDEATQAAEMLSDLLDNMVYLPRLRAGDVMLETQRVDLSQLDQTLAQRLASRARGRTLQLKFPQNEVGVDKELLERALLAMLAHSLKHTPPGGVVRLEASLDETRLVLTLRDEGPPFDPSLTPSLLATSLDRGPESSGTRQFRSDRGLPMLFAGHAIRAMGGNAEVRSEAETPGVTFTVTLPVEALNHR